MDTNQKTFRLSDYYNPLKYQRLFHESQAKYKLYMGGVGSGKTTALVWEVLLNSLETDHNYGLVGRYTYPELRDTTMHEFFEILPDILIQSWLKTENKLVLVNGSTIIFRHLEDPDKLKSLNLGFFAIDEQTEVPENVFLMLQSRLRRKNVRRRCGFGSTNPEGHDWCYNKFNVQHKDDPDYLFLIAPSTENPHLPAGYVEDLIKSFPEAWVKRFIFGDPSAFAGQILTDFNERTHKLKEFQPPNSWTKICVLDHGTNNPTAVLLVAIHPEGFWVVYREHYATGQIVGYHAKKIREMTEDEDIDYWIADPDIFNKTQQDPKRGLHSIADLYAEEDLHFSHADNDIKSGLELMLRYFKPHEELINPFTGKPNSPRIFVTDNCPNALRELPQWAWETHKVRGRAKNLPEKPAKANDHTVDCVRYALMTRATPKMKKIRNQLKAFPNREDSVWNALIQQQLLRDKLRGQPVDLAEDWAIKQAIIEGMRRR